MTIIKTERTLIREFSIDDLYPLFKIYSDRDVMQYIGDGQGFSLEETKVFIEKMIIRYHEFGYSFWIIESMNTKEILGHCGVMLERTTGLNEIGYTIAKQYWRQGYAIEVSKAVMKYAIEVLELKEIVAYTKVENIPSQEVMKKLGMKFWKSYIKDTREYIAFKKEVL